MNHIAMPVCCCRHSNAQEKVIIQSNQLEDIYNVLEVVTFT